jgi:hypothetical protein
MIYSINFRLRQYDVKKNERETDLIEILWDKIKEISNRQYRYYIENNCLIRSDECIDTMTEILYGTGVIDSLFIIDITNSPKNGIMPKPLWNWLKESEKSND